jgi:molybdate transport system regulatory protein
MTSSDPRLKIKVQIFCGSEIAMGPGKADLLDAIGSEGSISAAARALGMSYRRAWLLVDTMNRCWAQPLVEATAGGGKGGGARVTDFGHGVLDKYRTLNSQAQACKGAVPWPDLRSALRPAPQPSGHD